MAEDRVHDLLPWYASRTLPSVEKGMFEEHLPSCRPCQEELAMLEKLQVELDRHGESFLADHPPPEDLVALLMPGQLALEGNRARELKRHLALCATCAEEASWLKGEAVAERAVPPPVAVLPVSRRPWTGWAAAAAAVVVLAVGLSRILPPGSSDLPSDVLPVHFVEATQRADGEPTELRVPSDARFFHLILEIDLAPTDFPAELEIEGAGATRVYRKDGIDEREVYSERFLFLRLRRDDLPDGSYVARLSSSTRREAPTLYPFRVTSVSAP